MYHTMTSLFFLAAAAQSHRATSRIRVYTSFVVVATTADLFTHVVHLSHRARSSPPRRGDGCESIRHSANRTGRYRCRNTSITSQPTRTYVDAKRAPRRPSLPVFTTPHPHLPPLGTIYACVGSAPPPPRTPATTATTYLHPPQPVAQCHTPTGPPLGHRRIGVDCATRHTLTA